ncbi:MAG: hypothetical protein WCA98_16295 [Candidatus Acidiferrales bacterium]
MIQRLEFRVLVPLVSLAALAGIVNLCVVRAQEMDIELSATARLLPDVGSGLRAIHRDAAGHYYVLTAPGAAVSVYNADGKLLRQIPAAPSKEASLVYGEDFDIDAAGDVIVADHGANEIKIFDPSGHLVKSFTVEAPISVAALAAGELAITSLHSRKLVEIFDENGKWLRDFGDFTRLVDRPDLNRNLNAGRLVTDYADRLYYAFSYVPEPTVRRYDRLGHSTLEILLQTLEFAPVAESTRRKIGEQDDQHGTVTLKPVINAIGVDPQSFDIWIAIDDELAHFDKDGNRKGETYRTFTADGSRVAPTSLLVEPRRLLLAADPIGVYAFDRPDKAPGVETENPSETPPDKSAAPSAPKP